MSAGQQSDESRTVGLLGATGVGVGAIVGGGIFVLAGVAFATTGPAAVVAFSLNGLLAFLTAMTFAEISSAFPESGGAYTFAKKVLSVRAAFATGWILWFAYIVAGVLYALGFAAFAVVAIQEIWGAIGSSPPDWLAGRRTLLFLGLFPTGLYALNMARKNGGGGNWETVGKVAVFGVLVVAGAVALVGQPIEDTKIALSPFFSGGGTGLMMAMGFTFIALQGFDLVAAIAGEIKDPGHVIPKAMFLSLACALAIYIPLLLLVASVGVEPGDSVGDMARRNPETIIAIAAKQFLGVVGYWLVIVAALLSTLSALQANLMAASRVALSMARDRTLPPVLADLHSERKTPVMAIAASTLTLSAILFMVPDVASAGAAASLIFLISFTLAHLTTYLARRRGGTDDAPYKTPWFPLVPLTGGIACTLMAIFQAILVPDATGILVIWIGLGVILYWSLFARRAELADVATAALDPSLVSLRGHSPLILVPIANPQHTPALVSIANALAARGVGRVMLLSIVPAGIDEEHRTVPPQLKDTQRIIYDALAESFQSGHSAEALISTAPKPMEEIRRIADEHRCASLLLGMGEIKESSLPDLELLLNDVDCDVGIMRAPAGWHASKAIRILVPIAGKGGAHDFRVRLLASLCRATHRQVTFVTVIPTEASEQELTDTRARIQKLSELRIPGELSVKVLQSDAPLDALEEESKNYDLIVLGLRSVGWGKRVFGTFTLQIAARAACATLLLSRRRTRAYELLDPIRDDVVDSIRDVVRKGASSSIAPPFARTPPTD
jgi:amino acid transporter